MASLRDEIYADYQSWPVTSARLIEEAREITLRRGHGGVQGSTGIVPDLTTMGKIIDGGLPIGVVGGRRELMQRFHPDEPEPVMHASTFSGNPLSMAAGYAGMALLA